MHELKKRLHGQSVPTESQELSISEELISKLKNDKVFIQGLDPGIITTASDECATSMTLFESVKRYQSLSFRRAATQPEKTKKEAYHYELTSNVVDEGVLGAQHRLYSERRQKEDKRANSKDLDRKKVTQKILRKKFYQKYRTGKRYEAFLAQKQSSVKSFVGNWSQIGAHIHGHSRRSLKPSTTRLGSITKDNN
jgi:hypothetical protein